jgi:hypothetical protein
MSSGSTEYILSRLAVLGVLSAAACTSGADYELQLRPIVPQNQSPFEEIDSLHLVMEHADGQSERHILDSTTGSPSLSELGILDGTVVRLEALVGEAMVAVGRSGTFDLSTGQQEKNILFANLNDLGWLEDHMEGLFLPGIAALGNGRFLIAGGITMNSASNSGRRGKKIYELNLADPADPIVLEEVGEMPPYPAGIDGENGTTASRHGATTVLLTQGPHKGKVLVAGGTNTLFESQNVTNTAFLFDPESGVFESLSEEEQPNEHHYLHNTVMDASGNVVVLGGWDQTNDGFLTIQDNFDFFDASAGQFDQSSKNRTLRSAGAFGMAAALGTSGVVHCGGAMISQGDTWRTLAECSLITPSGELSDEIPDMPLTLSHGEMIAISSAELLVIGGVSVPDLVEIGPERAASNRVLHYDHTLQKWTTLESLKLNRANPALSLLPDGRVLILGGRQSADLFVYSATAQENILSCVEIYDPDIALNHPTETPSIMLEGCTSSQATSLLPTRAHSIATAQDPDFGIIAVGGLNSDGSQPSISYWPFKPESD